VLGDVLVDVGRVRLVLWRGGVLGCPDKAPLYLGLLFASGFVHSSGVLLLSPVAPRSGGCQRLVWLGLHVSAGKVPSLGIVVWVGVVGVV
jgi:hypothetical protein